MARGRFRSTYPHRRPFWTIVGLGFVVVSVAVFGLFVVMTTLKATSSDVGLPPPSAFRNWFYYVYALGAGTIAALSLAGAWYWSGMSRTPTPKRGLWHMTLSMLTACGVLALIMPFLMLLGSYDINVSIVIEILFYTFFIVLAFAVVITGRIAFPAGWFIGRWARRLHDEVTSPDAVAEHFS